MSGVPQQESGVTYLELSPREKRVCQMLADGLDLPKIAEEFGVSYDAVRHWITRAMQRERCPSSLRLVVRYLQEYCGVLDPIPESALPER